MLSERQKLVLIAIIEEYVKTNEPVGSFALSKRPELNFSTATLRNEMAQLEEMGFLEKTHTSSGRIPSEKGYRFYVETIMRKSNEKDANFPMIDEIFERPNVTREEAITESMEIVTELTNYATIALGKTSYNSRIKKLEFVSLKENYAVILMVTDQGHVESKRIMVPAGISIREIERTISILDEVLHNCLLSDIQNQLLDDITNDEIRDYINYHSDLVDAFVNAFTEMVSDKYHISGKYNILTQPEFQDVGKVREFLNAIEKKDILRIVKSDSMGISIKIGQENELKVMQDCTVITVPYETNSGSVGAITVFGPTRMEYDKVIPLLEYIAKNMKRIV